MKLVLDASVALKWFLRESDSPETTQLRADAQNGVHELSAPDFFPVEISHALSRAERQRRITRAKGSAFVTDLMTELPTLHPSAPLVIRAYTISSATRQGMYDCVYVALAERIGGDLVTTDRKLIANLSRQFPFVKPLSSF